MKIKDAIDSFTSFQTNLCHEIWKEVSMPIQIKKLDDNRITDPKLRKQILDQLKIRPSFLAHISEQVFFEKGYCRFLEVGTAEGLQSITIAKTVCKSEVFTCDIRDVRHNSFDSLNNAKFFLGNSKNMTSYIDQKIDVCWIDGAHDHYSVIKDFLAILPHTDHETLWAFDDFDLRFGCYRDIEVISHNFLESYVINFGTTASGNPSNIAVMRGFGKHA
jgi:hypothetical protein